MRVNMERIYASGYGTFALQTRISEWWRVAACVCQWVAASILFVLIGIIAVIVYIASRIFLGVIFVIFLTQSVGAELWLWTTIWLARRIK